MKKLGKWMLGAAMAAGTFAMTAVPAHAGVRIGVAVGPAAYVPPCPGPGYVWANGYYSNGYWIAGRWNFVGVREPAYVVHRDVIVRDHFRDRDWDRDRDRDRHYDRDRR